MKSHKTETRGVWQLQFKMTREAWSYRSNFLIESLGLFTFNFLRKIWTIGGTLEGSLKWGRHFFSGATFRIFLFSGCTWTIETYFFFKTQISDPLLTNCSPVLKFICLLHPITATSKTHWFWQFFQVFWKTGYISNYLFLNYIWTTQEYFLPILTGGSRIIFH